MDRFYVYDNSVDDRDAQLVLRAAEGRVVSLSFSTLENHSQLANMAWDLPASQHQESAT